MRNVLPFICRAAHITAHSFCCKGCPVVALRFALELGWASWALVEAGREEKEGNAVTEQRCRWRAAAAERHRQDLPPRKSNLRKFLRCICSCLLRADSFCTIASSPHGLPGNSSLGNLYHRDPVVRPHGDPTMIHPNAYVFRFL